MTGKEEEEVKLKNLLKSLSQESQKKKSLKMISIELLSIQRLKSAGNI